MQKFHILNGNSLQEQFPATIVGTRIVFRECLVDGPVQSDSPEEFYEIRSKFISENYDGCSAEEYLKKTVPEIERIRQIPQYSEINLWFEDDLFCQVNLWFVVHLLNKKIYNIHLVRPLKDMKYGFASYDGDGLISLFEERILVSKISELAKLWICMRTMHLTIWSHKQKN